MQTSTKWSSFTVSSSIPIACQVPKKTASFSLILIFEFRLFYTNKCSMRWVICPTRIFSKRYFLLIPWNLWRVKIFSAHSEHQQAGRPQACGSGSVEWSLRFDWLPEWALGSDCSQQEGTDFKLIQRKYKIANLSLAGQSVSRQVKSLDVF